MGQTNFSGPVKSANGFIGDFEGDVTGDVTGNVAGSIVLPTYTVANLPAANNNVGRLVRVSNGNAGQPCLAVSIGGSWLRVVYGAAVATS